MISLSFDSLRSSILDSANLVHHMDSVMRLIVEDDVSDAEQEACAHQMVQPWTGDPEDEGRGKQGDTCARKVIQWTNKAWMPSDLKLSVIWLELVVGKTLGS